jgi:hypothetical protein
MVYQDDGPFFSLDYLQEFSVDKWACKTRNYGYNAPRVFLTSTRANEFMMTAFLKKLFRREDNGTSEPQPEINHPSINANQERIQRAAESILENEALTADLDDAAAKVLLDWGVTRARQIAAETIGMDDVAAEEVMYQPMRALRKMLRAINQWVMVSDETGLQKIIEQAEVTYGSEYIAPGSDQSSQFLDQIDQWSDNLPEMIRQLRNFVENQPTP